MTLLSVPCRAWRVPRSCRRSLLRAAPLAALLVALLGATAARAALAPQAKAVLDRYVQAMGGSAFLDEKSLRVLGTIQAFMMKGVTESWTLRPDRTASRLELGPLKLRTGFDGTVGWRTDPNGKVLKLDGKDLDEAKGSAWFETAAYLLPDQGGGTVEWAGEEADSSGRYLVLEMTPPAGRSRRVYFDATSGLLVKELGKNDQQTIVTRFSDYRRFEGRLLPARTTTEIVGQPLNTFTVTVDSAWVDPEIPASLFAMPAEQGPLARFLKTPGVARVPFEYRERHVWIRASVNGRPPADFIFDTGASITVIDSAYAARIGLRTEGEQQGQGAGATGRASFASLKSLRVEGADGDGIEMPDVKVAVLSVNSILAPFFWKDCAGIIGFDFIDRFVDEIDYDGRMLTFYDPKSFHYSGRGTAIPMTLAGHTPVVKMKLDGTYEGDFRVDVGSGSTVDLHTPFVDKYGLADQADRSVEVMGGGFGGTFQTRIVRMKKIEIGPYSWSKPLVSLSEATAGAFTSEDYAGNIGNRILERFKVTLDYDRRQLWLEPGRLYGRRDAFTRTGLQLGRLADTVRVMFVLEGSPAQKAGIRAGEAVLALDGKPMSDLTPDEVTRVLDEGPPGRHTLTMLRGGKVKKVSVQLKEML